jgi:hypothetical protein
VILLACSIPRHVLGCDGQQMLKDLTTLIVGKYKLNKILKPSA